MAHVSFNRPVFNLLKEKTIRAVIDEAVNILENVGVVIENEAAIKLLSDYGVKIDKSNSRAFIPCGIVERCLETAPRAVKLYDRDEKEILELTGDSIYFNPGSAALNILDYHGKKIRKPVTEDFINFSRITDHLKYIKAQSTSLICSDVPEQISDSYRLYLALMHCSKPIITGTFSKESFSVMKDILIAIRGGKENLREKPLAIFDACPSPPLKWSNLTCQSLLDSSRYGIPSELVSMPLSGATAPVTKIGTLVQHTAETLSGIVITQLAEPGSPVIYGGSPAIFDMRKGTTPMGAIGTMMIDSAYVQIGKYLGLPTHAYMGLSDSKVVDYQAGLESGIGIIMAALSGINVISGPGMLNFESCQSIEKLVIDNEICGMAYHLIGGISVHEPPFAINLLDSLKDSSDFLSDPHTLKWFKHEGHFPGDVIDRESGEGLVGEEMSTAWDRANWEVKKLLDKGEKNPLDQERKQILKEIMGTEASKYGFRIRRSEG